MAWFLPLLGVTSTTGAVMYPEEAGSAVATLVNKTEQAVAAYNSRRRGQSLVNLKTKVDTLGDRASDVIKKIAPNLPGSANTNSSLSLIEGQSSHPVNGISNKKLNSFLPLLAVTGSGRAKVAVAIALGVSVLQGNFAADKGMQPFSEFASQAGGLLLLGAIADKL